MYKVCFSGWLVVKGRVFPKKSGETDKKKWKNALTVQKKHLMVCLNRSWLNRSAGDRLKKLEMVISSTSTSPSDTDFGYFSGKIRGSSSGPWREGRLFATVVRSFGSNFAWRQSSELLGLSSWKHSWEAGKKKKICSFVIPDSALRVPCQGSSMVMSWAVLRSDRAEMQIGIGSVQTKAALLLFEAVCKKSLQNRLFCEMPAPSRCRSQPDPRRCFFSHGLSLPRH